MKYALGKDFTSKLSTCVSKITLSQLRLPAPVFLTLAQADGSNKLVKNTVRACSERKGRHGNLLLLVWPFWDGGSDW